jgi:hypothetical protein
MVKTTDPARKLRDDERGTGIFVRVKDGERWGNADICELTTASLLSWLRGRGQRNDWAEACCCMLLGHTHEQIDAAVKELDACF